MELAVPESVHIFPSLRKEMEASQETSVDIWSQMVKRDELKTMVINSGIVHGDDLTRGSQHFKSVRGLSLADIETKLKQPQTFGW